MPNPILQNALDYHALGFNVTPAIAIKERDNNGKIRKRPPFNFTLKTPLRYRQTEDNVIDIFQCHPDTKLLGLICGSVSAKQGYKLVLLDFDSEELFQRMIPVIEPLLNSWVVKTKRGYHIWVYLPENIELPKSLTFGKLGSMDIIDDNYGIVPDSEDTELGLKYTFENRPELPLYLNSINLIEPLLELSDKYCTYLENNNLKNKKSILANRIRPPVIDEIRYSPEGRPYGVTKKAWAIIKSGGDNENYRSRSEADMAAMVSLVRQGFSEDAALNLFFNNAPASSKCNTLDYDGTAYLRGTYQNARLFITKKSRSQVEILLERVLAYISNYNWPDKLAGRTDRRIMMAMISIAYRTNKKRITISCRELAELAGKSRSTVSPSLERLKELKFINILRKGRDGCKTIEIKSAPLIVLKNDFSGFFDMSDLSHDLWRGNSRECLGDTGWELWHTLLGKSDTGNTAEEILLSVSFKRNTLNRLFTKMKNPPYSMIRIDDKRIIPMHGVDLNQITVQLGIYGLKINQQKKHESERQNRW